MSISARIRARAVVLTALVLTLLSCGDGGGGGDKETPPDTTTDASSATAEPDASSVVRDANVPACPPGNNGCACGAGNYCATGLRCSNDVCNVCPAGTANCPCGSGDSCGPSLSCMNGLCAAPACKPGDLGCPCDVDSCAAGLACASDKVCQSCRADLPGCPCIGGSCSMGLACTDDVCRAGPTCDQLRATGECFAHQACVETPGVGGACVTDVCEQGWVFDKDSGGCVECAACVIGRSCVASTAGIGDECAAAYRTCAESSGVASCGACVDGANLVDGKCVPTIRCGDSVCTDGQYCDRVAKTCAALPCAAGSAKSAGPNGMCAPCSTSCTGTGLTGRYWPFRTLTDKCVCETYEGFYLEASALKAEQCDADDDGWVRLEADDSSIREDNALLQNARCDIQRVDRVILRDEYGVEQALDSCRAEGFVRAGAACGERFPLRLLESGRNDAPGASDPNTPDGQRTPLYGPGVAPTGQPQRPGRRLSGPELNGLTKACVNELGDFDDDGVEDIKQTQPAKVLEAMTDSERLHAFSYFIELYRSRYVAPSARPYGDLLLVERSRCDADFPFHYSDKDSIGTVGANNSDPSYWRTCTRFRDPSFDGKKSGFDFAQYTCANTSGACDSMPGPASPTLAFASVDPKVTLLRDIGLCSLNGKLPKDGEFRGFGHHSQFRCLKVAPAPAADRPWEAAPAAFEGNGKYVFNRCAARACAADTKDCREARDNKDGFTVDPYVDCSPQVPAANSVGFAALKYQPYGSAAGYTTNSYAGGCVNEDTQWGSVLCPAQEFATTMKTDSFGRYSCYGAGSQWLWAAPSGQIRSTLIWAATSGPVTPTTPAWCN